MLVDQGHQGFKGKVGGLSLAEDLERMELVREIIGPERDLMNDVTSTILNVLAVICKLHPFETLEYILLM